MSLKYMAGKKSRFLYILFFLLVLLQLEFFIPDVLGRKETIPGNGYHDFITPNETVSYNFSSNNVQFDISSNTSIELNIEYASTIKDRQIMFIVNNSKSITLNVTSQPTINDFNIPNSPAEPSKGNYRYQYQYNCIYRVRSNQTIDDLKIRYTKNPQYGLNPNYKYTLVLLEADSESWEIIETLETEMYLEGTFLNLNSDANYYITIYEITELPFDWTWIIVFISIIAIFGVIALSILISKKDYFHYLKTRTVPVEKGAHRLTLEQVLENENRNKIIDLILKKPGIHFNELLREMDIAAGNLVWHLDILKTYKVIGKKRIGNFVAYFPYYQKNPLSNIDLKLQKSKLTLEILEMIEKEPGIWNNFITKKMKVDHKTIQYHIDKLIELDVINLKKEGRKKKIYPNFDSEYYKNKDQNDAQS